MTFLLLSQSILSPNGAVPVPPRFVPVVDRATAHHNGGACDFAVDQTGDPVSGAPMLSGVRDDLFGAWLVDMSYGRIGTIGRSKIRSFATIEDTQDQVRACLRKRATAPRRIGGAYHVRRVDRNEGWGNRGPTIDFAGGFRRQPTQLNLT